MLEAHIRKTLGDFELNVHLHLKAGGITVLWGPSGSGKTTLLNCLAGLLRPDAGRIVCSGRVWFDDQTALCLAPEQRRIGYVFQDVRLFPHLSVRSNLLFGQRFRGESDLSCADVVALLDLGKLLSRRPASLSGGEKQRVALGRALLSCPKFLLMDEPLTGLDKRRREEVMVYVKQIPACCDIPILYVTHSDAERAFLADQTVRIEDGVLSFSDPFQHLPGTYGVE